MRTQSIWLISLAVASMLFVGCGSSDDSGDKAPGTTSSPTSSNSIVGTWKDLSNGRVNIYAQSTYSSQFIKTYSSSGYEFDATSYWSYTEKGTKLVQPNDRNVTKVDLVRTGCKVYMTPVTAQAVSDFNNASKCTFTDWSINVQKDVSSCTDTLIQANCIASNSKNIYFIEDNKLYFGYAQYPDADGYSDVLRLDYMQRQ